MRYPALSAGKPVLAVRGLSVALPAGGDRAYAVRGIDMEVRAGEIVAVIGESGSGKSVIAQAVMGLLPPGLRLVSGDIELDGHGWARHGDAGWRALRGHRVSMIFQNPQACFDPLRRIADQVGRPLVLHEKLGRVERRQHVLRALRAAGLSNAEQIAQRFPHQLSGGQLQRAMIASALILRPALLIADEPTTALDVSTQAQVVALLREVAISTGTAVLFISHDLSVVAGLADRIMVMRGGEVLESGAGARVLAAPSHAYTRALVDATPAMTPKRGDVQAGAPVVLEVRDVVKTHGRHSFWSGVEPVRALGGVSMQVRSGQTLGILGESGSGKTSLARCVAGLLRADGGQVLLDGVDLAGLRGHSLRQWRGRIQMVFQDPQRSLNPRRKVGESLVECAVNQGVPRGQAWERALSVLSRVGLGPQAMDRYPWMFSGGQAQRLCIARALVPEPRLLIADEPVSALDMTVQSEVLDLLESVQREWGLAMLFITHDLRAAARLCHRVAIMQAGLVVEEGEIGDVYARPAHACTQALLRNASGIATAAAWPDGAATERAYPNDFSFIDLRN